MNSWNEISTCSSHWLSKSSSDIHQLNKILKLFPDKYKIDPNVAIQFQFAFTLLSNCVIVIIILINDVDIFTKSLCKPSLVWLVLKLLVSLSVWSGTHTYRRGNIGSKLLLVTLITPYKNCDCFLTFVTVIHVHFIAVIIRAEAAYQCMNSDPVSVTK
jgi:hypothetical protein